MTFALVLRRKLQHRQSPGYATDGEVGGGQLLKMTSAYYVRKKLSLKMNYPKMMENANKKQHFLRLLDKNA